MYWVKVHSLQSQSDGGILDADDLVNDVADDREKVSRSWLIVYCFLHIPHTKMSVVMRHGVAMFMFVLKSCQNIFWLRERVCQFDVKFATVTVCNYAQYWFVLLITEIHYFTVFVKFCYCIYIQLLC